MILYAQKKDVSDYPDLENRKYLVKRMTYWHFWIAETERRYRCDFFNFFDENNKKVKLCIARKMIIWN